MATSTASIDRGSGRRHERERAQFETIRNSITPARWKQTKVVVQSRDTGTRNVLVEGGADARNVPTATATTAARRTTEQPEHGRFDQQGEHHSGRGIMVSEIF